MEISLVRIIENDHVIRNIHHIDGCSLWNPQGAYGNFGIVCSQQPADLHYKYRAIGKSFTFFSGGTNFNVGRDPGAGHEAHCFPQKTYWLPGNTRLSITRVPDSAKGIARKDM